MNRRAFGGLIAAAIAGAVLDPERLLWTPGKKLISIPNPSACPALDAFFHIGDIIRFGCDPLTYRVTGVFSSEGRVTLSPNYKIGKRQPDGGVRWMRRRENFPPLFRDLRFSSRNTGIPV